MTELLDVLGLDPSDSIVRALAFALPVAVFLTLLVLLRVKSKNQFRVGTAGSDAAHAPAGAPGQSATGKHASDELESAAPTAGAPADVAVLEPARSVDRHAIDRQAIDHPAADTVTVTVTVTAAAASAPPAAREDVPAAPVVSEPALNPIEALKLQLADAAATAPKAELAPLYLELAKHCRSAGDEAAFMAALRSAAGYGALHGPRAAHAAARIELAEVALNSGDAIGACEQWQIARLVLHEEGLKDAYQRIDKRMRDNGCPTDWVLTDF